MVIVQVLEIHHRIVEIYIVVVIALKIIVDVIAAAHRDRSAKGVRMLEVCIRREESSQTRSGGQRPGVWPTFVSDQRQDFVGHVAVVSSEHLDLPRWMRFPVQQTVFVYR